MCPSEQYQNVCKAEFGELHTKLDRLDVAIRGNGKPGIQVRLYQLESAEKSRSRLLWLAVGAIVTLAATGVWQRIFP